MNPRALQIGEPEEIVEIPQPAQIPDTVPYAPAPTPEREPEKVPA